MQCVGLRCAIVVFPDQTHLLFLVGITSCSLTVFNILYQVNQSSSTMRALVVVIITLLNDSECLLNKKMAAPCS